VWERRRPACRLPRHRCAVTRRRWPPSRWHRAFGGGGASFVVAVRRVHVVTCATRVASRSKLDVSFQRKDTCSARRCPCGADVDVGYRDAVMRRSALAACRASIVPERIAINIDRHHLPAPGAQVAHPRARAGVEQSALSGRAQHVDPSARRRCADRHPRGAARQLFETARASSRAAVCVSTVIETSTTSMEPSVERVSR
jgi:hypothetical protein